MRLKVIAFVVLDIVWIILVMVVIFSTPAIENALGIRETGSKTVIPPLAIGVLIVAFVAPTLLFNRVINRKPGWTKSVLADGKQARATITRVDDTGMTINNAIYVKIHLHVEATDEPPFEATMSTSVSRVSIPSVGDTLWVKYDPNHKNHIAVLDEPAAPQSSYRSSASRSFNGSTTAASKDIAKELADLAQLHKNGDLTDAEYSAAKHKLLG